ncbi:MAG: RDD family protein [Terriglobia bacterium]
MKCPGCGFVSFPDAERCKRCGYEFDGPKSQGETASAKPAVGEVLLSEPHTTPLMEKLSSAGGDGPWVDESPARVPSYRRRRAGIHGRFDARSNPKLDFEHEARDGQQPLAEAELDSSGPDKREVDMVFGAVQGPMLPNVDPGAVSLQESVQVAEPRGRRTIDLEDSRGPTIARQHLPPKRQPTTIHQSVFRAAEVHPDGTGELPVASVGQRLLAGMADAAILLFCGALFAGIFVVSGGHLHPSSVNLVVFGLVSSALIFGYFGTFAAVTHATPGGHWMGISIRNLEGEIPTTGQSLLRAFGYLVAAAAFMIGFLWIVMDSGGMGWHDHMSGTLPLALGRNSR